MALDGVFHQHLEVCARCANNPFNLCAVGDKLIRVEAESLIADLNDGGSAPEAPPQTSHTPRS